MGFEFDHACTYIRANPSKFGNTDLLYLYGRYKVVTEGRCTTDKPAFYQLKEKSKWQAWSDLGDMDPEIAEEQYVERLDCLEPEWRGEVVNDPTSGWIGVSCPLPELSVPDLDKTFWDWVKVGNLGKLEELVTPDNINDKDEDGLALIHWASDRGHSNVITHLHKLDLTVINTKDGDGQTPLHYAASCGHGHVVKLLLESGADPSISDSDGFLPNNSDIDDSIKHIFDRHQKDS